MTDGKGALIVIEGTPDTGVSEQHDLLSSRLQREGYDVVTMNFPRLDAESSFYVRQYENEVFGSKDTVSAYTASLFYALDRYSVVKAIDAALKAGKIVLCSGYTGTNMAQQGMKFAHPEQRRGFFIWLDNLEFQMLGLPRPNHTFVLAKPQDTTATVPTETNVYLDLCTLFPKDFQRVDVYRGTKLLEASIIHDQLWKTIELLLPQEEVPVGQSSEELSVDKDYIIPESLEGDVRASYTDTLDAIMTTHHQLKSQLQKYIASVGSSEHEALAEHVARLVLPASNKTAFSYVPVKTVPNGAHTVNSITSTSLQLVNYYPRNEMDTAKDILLETSDKAPAQVTRQYNKMAYEDKARLIEDYLKKNHKEESLLDSVAYTFNVQSSFADYVELASKAVKNEVESLSPRHGFDVPEILEEAGLVDQYEACFDASFALYSLLQKHGLYEEAQYATLLGHKLEASITYRLRDLIAAKQKEHSVLLRQILSQVEAAHPYIFSLI